VLTCLFWNFKCSWRNKEAIAARLAVHHGVDILVLAESGADPELLLSELRRSDPAYQMPSRQHYRFQIFTKFPGSQLKHFREHDRMSIRKLCLPGRREVLFGVIHFYDRRNHDRDVQHSLSREVYSTLHEAENAAGHCRTVLVGDFNMNPFDKGMIDPNGGFGAMLNVTLASRHTSGAMGKSRRFYNPMWTRLGQDPPAPPGTHYWKGGADPFNVFWHSLDQVLVRPTLIASGSFRDSDFRILTSIPGEGAIPVELVRSTGKHWEIQVSDHLPIIFKLMPSPEADHV
jgi:hypothetical protein